MIGKKSIVSILSLATLASCASQGENQAVKLQEGASVATTASADGVKSGEILYKTPAGDDVMKVSVTLQNGVITQASATPLATNAISLKLQTAFAEKVSENTVGKAIKGLKVDTISGASLTTTAFNEFLAKNAN